MSAFISGKINRLNYWIESLNAEHCIYVRGLCRRRRSRLCLILEVKTNPTPTENFSETQQLTSYTDMSMEFMITHSDHQSQPVLRVLLRSDMLSLLRMKSFLLSTVDKVQKKSHELGGNTAWC